MSSPAPPLAPVPAPGRLQWATKLRHFLLVLAFCLAISALHQAFLPDKPYPAALTYSLAIGLATWLLIDFGRHAFPSSAETGWPPGLAGLGLVVGGVAAGYLFGSLVAGEAVERFGWQGPADDPAARVRRTLLISVVAGLVGTWFFYTRSRAEWLERRMGEAQRHAGEARLKLLEAQLEPHMLFNTLANLRALIGTDPQRAQQMLDHMIAYLRATLEASRITSHPLQSEFDRLRDYLELMAIRMGPRLAYALELPPELATRRVPALLLQPLVENSIRHGLEPRVEGGRVRITARRAGSELLLEVVDTGTGDGVPAPAGSGFGLAQVRDRLATLYGAQASLELAPLEPHGMRALVRLPLAP